ncbi:hypothetical protein FJTKL_07703 [Diaporthe vaccinii]|uniref:J domain-containing protein n=1 Tax=Diaporthe vaccinii TaxID=105482 RepID=A0ABR4ETD2_9PEZI
MSAQKPDYYAVLGVPAESTSGAIRKAFFKLSMAHHPDRRDKSEFDEAHKEFVLISAAYNVLKNEESRNQYNSSRARRMQRPTAQSHFNRENPWSSRENDDDDAFEPPKSQFLETLGFTLTKGNETPVNVSGRGVPTVNIQSSGKPTQTQMTRKS